MANKLLEYFKGDELASNVFKSKYAQEEDLTPDDMHKRMAKEFAKIEYKYQGSIKENKNNDKLSNYGKKREYLTEQSIYELFKDFKYIVPQGRIMAGLGVYDSYRSLSNCLRLPPPKDSYSSITYVDATLVAAAKRGCGYGLGISNLRPKGVHVKNSANSSTGAVSFMPRYSFSTREVAQDGRRGACLIDIDINHPDSLDFINSKKDRTQITGANISVKVNSEFMKAVENDERYVLRFPCDFYEKNETWVKDLEEGKNNAELNVLQPIISGNDTIGYTKVIKAKEYWNEIINNAWENAEPGVFFWDKVINYDPCSVYPQFQIDGTNACGEQPMCVYDTCRLILLNLFSFVDNPFTSEAKLNGELLYKYAYEQMRLGDDLVDLEIEYINRIIEKIKADPEPIEEKQIDLDLWKNVSKIAKEGRRVGCGITALADMIAALNLKYDSKEALDIVEKVMSIKMKAELDCTSDLAILRGTFIGWDSKLEWNGFEGNNDFYKFISHKFPIQFNKMMNQGRRNINWSTIAPAGTVSLMTQSTSGCEPLFSPYYFRRKKINPNEKNAKIDFVDQNGDSWTEFPVLHPKFKDWIETTADFTEQFNAGLITKVEDFNKATLQSLFEQSPWYKSTANDIDWTKRVEMQSILQKYTTSAISTTLNLPQNITKEEVSEIYLQSWKKGLKGQTIYRDGSRSGVLITESTKDKQTFEQKDAPKRPGELPCEIHYPTIKNIKYTVIVGLLDSKPYEVFAIPYEVAKGYKNGFLSKTKSGVYNLIASLDEKSTIHTNLTGDMSDTEAALTRLISTSLRHGAEIKFIVEQLNKTHGDLFSFSKIIARVLKKYIPEGAKSTVKCQDCGSENVIFQEGCQTCQSCGSSKCG
jgi:ribonucleoside-diphosphate reductase alpha chain